ncbi:MAG: alpha/beta hydrolase [Clostridiales bacterium]|nr:alpha/beta hydrolase [Clostridiales bacterium]
MKLYEIRKVNLPNRETLAYRKAGSGDKTVLLIHGNMSSSLHWLPAMERLESGFTVYAPDLRGFGDSTYTTGFDSLAELSRDLEMFADALGIGGCVLCGWSTGGGVAMEFAAARPVQTDGLILLDSVPPTGYPMFKKGPDLKAILTEPLKTKEDVANDPVQVLPAVNALKAGDRAVMKSFWDFSIYNLKKPPDEEYEIYLDGIMKQRNLVDVDYALLTFNITDRLPLINCPVAVMHGEKDMVVPYAWGLETHRLFGRHAKLISFADAGHSPITDVPDEFFEALEDILRQMK